MPRTAAAVATVALMAVAAAQDSAIKVKVGEAFPDVKLKAAQVDKLAGKKAGDTVSVADLKGKNVVVFFYPRAMTPGCTVESCGFRDLAKDFPADAVLLGASNDDVPNQQKFIEKEKLPYPLLADPENKLINSLGILNGKASKRVTFVIGKDGKIAKIYDKVTPKEHPKEVLEFVKTQK